MNEYKISIITVCYNAERFIIPTIKSVVNQSFRSFEYLIIDGQSGDATVEHIRGFQKEFPMRLISEPDNGVYDAMNKGLRHAKGEYVLFLNSGDELSSPDTLAKIFSQNKDADLYYGETNIIDETRKIIGTRSGLTSRKLPKVLSKKSFLSGQVVSHQSFIPKRSLCPGFNLKYSCSADIDWMITITEKSTATINTGMVVTNYLQGGISDTRLLKCWQERLMIMLTHFGFFNTVLSHVKFVLRFVKYGKYRETDTQL